MCVAYVYVYRQSCSYVVAFKIIFFSKYKNITYLSAIYQEFYFKYKQNKINCVKRASHELWWGQFLRKELSLSITHNSREYENITIIYQNKNYKKIKRFKKKGSTKELTYYLTLKKFIKKFLH